MDIADTVIPAKPFIQAIGYQFFLAIGISNVSGKIYVGGPDRYEDTGKVWVYDPGGIKLNQFNVGCMPSRFYFDE